MSGSGKITLYGFEWGPMTVERTCVLSDGRRVLTIKSPRRTLELYMTEFGNIRIFERGGKEYKLP